MERDDIQTWRKWDFVVNVLLITVVLFMLARVAWGLDTQDIMTGETPGIRGASGIDSSTTARAAQRNGAVAGEQPSALSGRQSAGKILIRAPHV